jgi:hypothetical protein
VRSRTEIRMRVVYLVVALLAAVPLRVATASASARAGALGALQGDSASWLQADSAGPPQMQSASRPQADGPSSLQIQNALARVKADPNVATARKIHTLRWAKPSDPDSGELPQWIKWIMGLFAWLAQSSRFVWWVAAAVLASLLVVYLVRLVRTHGMPRPAARFIAPSHVRDLDIRPESLPTDVGAAARELWERGERRAALALLYRGLLSRLAHVHGVPIRDSSTEGDCLALAARYLNEDRKDYTSRLVLIWQRAGYGAEEVETEAVLRLCSGFAAALDLPPALDGTAGGAVAGHAV